MAKRIPYHPGLLQLELLERAEQFFDSYRDMPPDKHLPMYWPRYFAIAHAVELALKAYLAFHGIGEAQIQRQFGHKLKKMLRAAERKGLQLAPEDRSWIASLHTLHSENRARYPVGAARSVLIIDQFVQPTINLLEAVSTAIRGGPKRRLYVDY
jgi:hypothetical protein